MNGDTQPVPSAFSTASLAANRAASRSVRRGPTPALSISLLVKHLLAYPLLGGQQSFELSEIDDIYTLSIVFQIILPNVSAARRPSLTRRW
jgi:hypothetical protein